MSDWRQNLTAAFHEALDLIADDADPAVEIDASPDTPDIPGPPDLYTFYEALAVLRNEHRAGNRKTADALSQLSDTLQSFDERLAEIRADRKREQGRDSALPRGHLLAILDLGDRARRLLAALAEPPSPPLFGAGKWPAAWENVASAVAIFSTHVFALIDKAGVEKIETGGQAFDPGRMNAVSVVPATPASPSGSVVREISPGYLLSGEVLRLAEVEISR